MNLTDFKGFSKVAIAALTAVGLILAQPIVAAPAAAREAPTSFADLVDTLMPTVVNITTTQNLPQQGPRLRDMPQLPPGSPFEELFKEFFDRRGGEEQQQRRRGTSLGSGFIIDPSGYIVTNNHVIQGAEDITVILRDDTQLKAKLVGADSRADLAVLKVDPPGGKPLPAVKFGNSDKVRVGDWVIAIGNPFGLGHSVTAGIISARGRALSDSLDDYLQTDAAINKGNSGGPLFDADGEVIGVNTAIYSPSGTNAGLAFSIPSNLVKQVAEQLREFGRVRRGWIGVSYQSVTDDIADSFGLDKARGVLVANVVADGPAAKAGIKRNDIILSFGGQDVPDLRHFPRQVANARVGSTVDTVVWRGGKEQTLKLRIGEQDEPEKQNASAQGPAPNKKPVERDQPVSSTVEQLGLTLQKVSDQLREKYGLADNVKGVIVTRVAPDSPAAEKQLQPGDVIIEVDQKAVTSPQEVTDIVSKLQSQKKRSVLLFVERQGDPRFAALRLTK
ncbi:serine protease Do [Enhydrobacter aerosaccus]|uniref:Probable periplasmic serine endoprotease DegP-like n=1 Tax=Enhydrobacter aerosaccus TaxID=225324 RepID=A0A1T4T075_9HYPH|nr:DegQ family serine endoprotease [Enhydrobacter aerosaccus]SKA33651.1 serine protease Do [Enhydrobacter aerosaccus]